MSLALASAVVVVFSGSAFVVVLVVAIFLGIMNRVADRWLRLPHFLENFGGGSGACCSVTDYNKAVAAGSIVDRKVRVPETILTHAPADRTNRVTNADGVDELWKEAIRMNNLFVPFISEASMSFAEQEKFFIMPQNAEAFVAEKMRENFKADYRLRFAAWAKERNFLTSFEYNAVGTSIFLLVVTIISSVAYFNMKWNAEEVVIYTTDTAGAVHKTVTTGKDRDKLLMFHQQKYNEDKILRGPVSRIQVLGGGMSLVCVTVKLNWGIVTCGFATSAEVKMGEVVFLRSGNMRLNEKNSDGNHYSSQGWVISEREARVLATNGFKVVE